MARDYKNHRRAEAATPRSGPPFVGGLALGLVIALAVFAYDRRVPPPAVATRKPVAVTPASRPTSPAPPVVKVTRPPDPQFDFYEMLPKFEVVIPEQDESAPAQPRGAPMRKAGLYILQAGSFRNSADAERVRALIALQGVQSKIQRVAIDRDTWHRVRIGPISDLESLEETRGKLRQAQIEALVIRIGG
jgi:cell division protein FtsN